MFFAGQSKFSIAISFLLAAFPGAAQNLSESHRLHPVIGSGTRGDGGLATAAVLDGPFGLAEDNEGNVYISESNAGLIRRVRPDGIIERFAGTGTLASGVEGLPALETDLLGPDVLLMDRDGGLIFADSKACRIRKVATDGTIRNLVGTGRCSGSSTGGFPGGPPGGGGGARDRNDLETEISVIGGMTLDSLGRLVFTDQSGNQVRRRDEDGVVRTIAGLGSWGFSGDGGSATSAQLASPAGLAFDDSGNLYIADGSNCRIRRVDPDGIITTVAGSGLFGNTGACASASSTYAGGVGAQTALGRLTALAYDRDSGSLLFGSPSQARVLRFNLATSRVSLFLGNGRRGAVDATAALEYSVDNPSSILVSARTGALVADSTSFHVLQVQAGAVTSFAGDWPQLPVYASASATPLLRPRGLCVNPDGSLIVVDAGAERLLSFRSPDQPAAFAGARYPTGYSGGDNGPATEAQINEPNRVACAPSGEVYVTHRSRIRVVDRSGIIRTVLQNLDNPTGVAVDAEGRLFFSETGAHRVSRYDPASRTRTVIAGTGTAGFSGDGGPATDALLNSPGDLALDSQGNLLIADSANRRVRRVSPDGKIRTVAGSGRSFSYTDISGEPATAIGLGRIDGMTVDAADNLYIAESPRVSVVRPDGPIYIVTGYTGEDDAGVKSYIDGPLAGADGLATDRNGWLYISVREGNRVITATPADAEVP